MMGRWLIILLALTVVACSESPEQSADDTGALPESSPLTAVEADDMPEPLGEPAADDPAEDLMADSSKPAGQIYNQYCVMCHSTGAAGAPKVGDTARWQEEMDHHSLDELIQNAIEGEGAMPPRGGCMECSDEDIAKVTRFMLEESSIEL